MAGNTFSARHVSPTAGDLEKSRLRSSQRATFCKERGYWTVGYGGNSVRLKDIRGFGYIAHLLRHPNTEFHVLDLYGGIASLRDEDDTGSTIHNLPRVDGDLEKAGIHITGPGDAGEMLDEQAKAAYGRRISELRAELVEAKALGQVERAEQAEAEIDALTKELSRAVGLGGRNRRAASASERARQSITKAIKSALDRIAQSEAGLADLLSRCIKTGTFCSYQPDPDFPLAWEFAETLLEQEAGPTAGSVQASSWAERPPTLPVALDVTELSPAGRTPFAGRESERSAIRANIDRALSGRGALVMLAGGPGVGKSRLAMEMAEYASRLGFKCVVGHCYERDEPFPYLPFVEMIESGLVQAASLDDFRRRMGANAAEMAQLVPSLRRVFPDIPQPLELPPAQRRRYLFQGVSEAFAYAARTRSYVLIFEDLQWADESTLALLIHLANRITQLPVLMIGTYRDSYSDGNPALVRTLEELIRMGIRPVKLSGLSNHAVAQMLNGLSQRRPPENLVNAIFEESQGNPFFVEELYRHLLEDGRIFDADGRFRTDIEIDDIDVPENVRLIIERRLARLDDSEKRVLAAAAVLGRSFSFQLLTAISQIDVDELFTVIEKAQRMGIIVASSEGPERPFTFGHELVRQTLLAGISAARQQRLHVAVADAIERLHPSTMNERAGEITYHLLKAGPFADELRLVHYLTLAGKASLETAAFEEARRSFRSALSHLSDFDKRERAEILADLAIAERGLDRWGAAFSNLQEAFDIYIGLGDREMIAKSCTELAGVFVWGGRFQELTENARRGLASLGTEISANRARLLAVLGNTHASAGRWEPANEALREALDIASRLSDQKLVARLHGARSIINFQFLRLREAASDGEKSRGSDAPPWQRAVELLVLYQTLIFLGRLKDAEKAWDELEPLSARIGQSYLTAHCVIMRAWVEFGRGADLAKLQTAFHQVLKSHSKASYNFWDVFSEVQLSLADFLCGNWASALSHAQTSRRIEVESSFRGIGAGTLFRQMAYASDHAAALAMLEDRRAWLPRIGQQNIAGSWRMLALVIEGLFVLGELEQAGALYPLAHILVDTGAIALWPIFRFTHTVAGIAAAAAHEWATAEDHFQTALRQAESVPHVLEQAEIHRFHAMMLIDRAARGDRERARELLNKARETYSRIGTPRHVDITQSLLERVPSGNS